MSQFMKKALAALLVVSMLCVASVGCSSTVDPNLIVDQNTPKPTMPQNPAPRPTNVAQEAEDDCAFIGTWDVTAQAFTAVKMTFTKEGTVTMGMMQGTIGGLFTYTDTELTITTDSKEMTGTYVVEGDTITVTTATDVIVLTKPGTQAPTETTAA